MADIYEYLSQISSAVYGREVRSAIHDAIEQCYEDATGNPDSVSAAVAKMEAAQTAIEQESTKVTNAVARIDKAVGSVTNGSDSTTDYLGEFTPEVWDSDATTKLYVLVPSTTTDILLQNSLSSYDYLDFAVTAYGQTQIMTFKVDTIKNGATMNVRFFNLPDTGSSEVKDNPSVVMGELRFKISTDTEDSSYEGIRMTGHSVVWWTGGAMKFCELNALSDGSVLDGAADSSSSSYSAALSGYCNSLKSVKVYGRKNRDSTELADARIASDGTEYASVGAAIRALEEEIASLKTELAAVSAGTVSDETVAAAVTSYLEANPVVATAG